MKAMKTKNISNNICWARNVPIDLFLLIHRLPADVIQWAWRPYKAHEALRGPSWEGGGSEGPPVCHPPQAADKAEGERARSLWVSPCQRRRPWPARRMVQGPRHHSRWSVSHLILLVALKHLRWCISTAHCYTKIFIIDNVLIVNNITNFHLNNVLI